MISTALFAIFWSLTSLEAQAADSCDEAEGTGPCMTVLPAYTLSLNSDASGELKLGAEIWKPVGKESNHELFLSPHASFAASSGVVNIPLLSGMPTESTLGLSIGYVHFGETGGLDAGLKQVLREANQICASTVPDYTLANFTNELCPTGLVYYRHHPSTRFKLSHALPEYFVTATGRIVQDAFTWRELDQSNDPATLSEEQSVRHASASASLKGTFIFQDSNVSAEGWLSWRSGWQASSQELAWCVDDEVLVDGETASTQSCDGAVIGEPSSAEALKIAAAIGWTSTDFRWRSSFQPFLKLGAGTPVGGVAIPFYLNVARLGHLTEKSTKNILVFKPSVSFPEGDNGVEPTLTMTVTIFGSGTLFDPTSTEL